MAVQLRRYRNYTASTLGLMLHDAAREALTDPNDRFHPSALHGYGDDLNGAIERAGRAIAADERDEPHTTGMAKFVVLQATSDEHTALGAATLDGSVTVLHPSRLDRIPGVTALRHRTKIGAVGLKGLNATGWLRPSAAEELGSVYKELADYDHSPPLWTAEPVGPENRLARAAILEAGFTPHLKPARFDLGEAVPSPELQLYVLPSRVEASS
jgi:hypothetical protein